MKLRIAALMLLAMPLIGCGASHLIVEQPNRSSVRAQALDLQYDNTVTGVPQSASVHVQQKMEEAFFGKNAPFARGRDITIRYRFIGYDKGSRIGRYFLGAMGVGEAQMVLEAEFVDPQGNILSRIRSEGEIGAGFFGGSSNSAINKAVKEIRQYAVTHFKG